MANFSRVNIGVLTLRTCSAMTIWAINDGGDGVGYCAAEQGNGDKSRRSGADARVYLYRPASHVRLSVCLPAPKPEDGETGEDFFERVGGISQRLNSKLSEDEDAACIQCESKPGSRLGSDVTLGVERLMALWRR